MHGRFLLFNSTHFGQARPAMQECRKAVERFRLPNRVDLYTAVILIADPASNTDFVRRFFYKPAKADALDTAGDEPAAGADPRFGQGFGSGVTSKPPLESASSIVARSFLIVNGLGIR